MSLRVLVTGVGGFVGGHLSQVLAAATDWQLHTVSRAPAAGPRHIQLDLSQATDAQLHALLANVDLCYHVAGMAHHEALSDADGSRLRAFNVTLTERLYRAALGAGVGSFVWLSSSKVLGDGSTSPLPVTAPYAPVGAYAKSKMLGEQALLSCAQAQTRLCIVRPPLIYGPGVGANFLSLVQLALGRWPVPLGQARGLRSFVGVANLCSALVQCAKAPAGTYHVCDAQPLSVADLIAGIQAAANHQGRLLNVPAGLLRLALQCVGRGAVYERLFGSLLLDASDSCRRLQWQPPYSSQAQLQETVSWYRSQR